MRRDRSKVCVCWRYGIAHTGAIVRGASANVALDTRIRSTQTSRRYNALVPQVASAQGKK